MSGKRHWTGKVPKDYRPDSSSSEDEGDEIHEPLKEERDDDRQQGREQEVVREQPVSHSDRRLARILEATKGESHQRSRGSLKKEQEDQETDFERRNRLRALALKSSISRTMDDHVTSIDVTVNEMIPSPSSQTDENSDEEGNSDDEDSDDEDSDDEEEEEEPRMMLKPVFVSKHKRETVKDRLTREAIEKEALKQQAAADIERKKLAHHLVIEEIQRAAADVEAAAADEFNTVDDTDELDPEAEEQAWVIRELGRIKRDRLEKDKREAEKADKERRSKMTDAELEAEKLARDALAEKKEIKFMQRYYHKGAFYTDDERVAEALSSRDFLQPTLEDRFNKEALPVVMQVKDFGKAGRTKYTHLTDQDTSRRDAGWNQDSAVTQKILGRLGGLKSSTSSSSALLKSNNKRQKI